MSEELNQPDEVVETPVADETTQVEGQEAEIADDMTDDMDDEGADEASETDVEDDAEAA